MPKESKVTKVMKEQRICEVQNMIIDQIPNAKIIEKIVTDWDISRRQAIRYLDEAFKLWNTETLATVEQKRQTRIAWLQNEIRDMGEKFNTPQGKRTRLAFAKELSKLEALYPAKKIEHSNNPDNPLLPIKPIEPIVFTIISNVKSD